MAAKFLSRLVLAACECGGRGGYWTVAEPFIFESERLRQTISVPVGFETDLASVPRLPFVYLVMAGQGNEAAVIHDYLYTAQPCTRAEADDVFYEAAGVAGMPAWRRWMMWAGIRLGGGSHWKARE